MKIRLHNTATRRKEVFEPIDPANVRMYVCGPTVYDRAHIGNARPVVVFDVLYRLLRHAYGPEHVTYVRNITDVEDKIIARAAERGVPIETVTEETTGWFHEDMAALGVDYRGDPQFHEPKATDYISEMVAMIETLIAAGKAYEAEGHVLFDVGAYPDYGKLAGRSTDDMIAGARVEVAPYKRDPMDFVLWKPSTGDQPGWESPWGKGRPGWHIECSAMSHALLGPDFDIHGGGADLTFPHHENEVAQSKCAHPGSGFARYWLHNGMIRVEGQKMAKSLGNFITVKDLRDEVPGEVIRLAILSTHYRGALDWTDSLQSQTVKSLEKWAKVAKEPRAGEVPSSVLDALADDLNTPLAIAEMHKLADEGDARGLAAAMHLLNLRAPDVRNFYDLASSAEQEQIRVTIEALLDARIVARQEKDYARADAIREAFTDAGVIIMDSRDGTEWKLDANFTTESLESLRRLEP